ncbi:hypothetical protein F5Y07DRAFT_409260 [Xylaria sp. FL0933]|nr:hypothetical protein F5Y07DRAFT_409260 [Xylaria sp. FL0933]
MDQGQEDEQNPQNPVRRSVGRPRRKDGKGGYYQSRGLRAQKTKFTQPPTEVKTRTRTGNLKPKDYRLRQPVAPRGSSRGGRGRPRRRPLSEDEEEEAEEEEADSQSDDDQIVVVDDDDDDDDDGIFNYQDDPDSPVRRQTQFDLLRKRRFQDDEDPGEGPSQPPPRKRQDTLAPERRRITHVDQGIRPDPKGKGPAQGYLAQSTSVAPLQQHHVIPEGDEIEDPADTQEELDARASIEQPAYSGRREKINQLDIRTVFPSLDSYIQHDEVRRWYWSQLVEDEFSKLWVREKHATYRFSQGPQDRSDSHELELWKMMFVRYGKIPPHLFTYGLKLGDDCYKVPGSLMMSSRASYLLTRICAHQIWGQDIDPLRYVLQKAVQASVPEHPIPIGAPLVGPEDLEGIEGFGELTEELQARLHLEVWSRTKPGAKPEMKNLLSDIRTRLRSDRSDRVPGEHEKTLFILTVKVMEDVLSVLDQFCPEIYSTTKECLQRFRRFYGASLDRIEPRDRRQLMDLKWSLELCELRDMEIRKVMRGLDHHGWYLYDVEHTSTTHNSKLPLYLKYSYLRPQTMSVFRGEVIDSHRAILQRLDRINDDRAKELDEFTQGLMEGVRRRDEQVGHEVDEPVLLDESDPD